MNENEKNFIVNKLNNGLLTVVKQTIAENLGVNVKLAIEENYYSWSGWCVTLNETGDDTTLLMTSNTLLAQIFKEAKIRVRVALTKDGKHIWFSTGISYDHNIGGGSNGRDLMTFYADVENDSITKI